MCTPTRARAFSLIDTMMAIVIIGIAVLIAIPGAAPSQSLRLVGAATTLVSDLEYAQSATLAAPIDPTVVRILDDPPMYWLARVSEPDKPISRPGSTQSYVVEFGSGDQAYLGEVMVGLMDPGGTVVAGTVAFDAFGRLGSADDARIRLSNSSGEIFVEVRASTGSVAIVR